MTAGFPEAVIQQAGEATWLRAPVELMDGELRMPKAEVANGIVPLWNVDELAPKGAVTGCVACWAMTRSAALSSGHFKEMCPFIWGERQVMRKSHPLLVASLALSLQNLPPSEATPKHIISILSEVGTLAVDETGAPVPGAALLAALRTQRDAVIPLHGPALIGKGDSAGWLREGPTEMFEIEHAVRALRAVVTLKGAGFEYQGIPLVFAVPGDGEGDGREPVGKKAGKAGEGASSGVRLTDSSKYLLLHNMGPCEWVARQSIVYAGKPRVIPVIAIGTAKGTSKVSVMVHAPEGGKPFVVSKECIIATLEKLDETLLELKDFCNTLDFVLPIGDTGLAAANLRADVLNAVRQFPQVMDFWTVVESLDRYWKSMVQRLYKGMERDKPSAAEWHFEGGASSVVMLAAVTASQKNRDVGSAKAAGDKSGGGGGLGAKPAKGGAVKLKGCCASFLAEEGACKDAAPGSTCENSSFRHACPCGEQHKVSACTKITPKDVVAAAKAVLAQKKH